MIRQLGYAILNQQLQLQLAQKAELAQDLE